MRSMVCKVMWVGRAATFCVGLTVVVAVVLGAGTTALAAVPGDPFKLGRLNTVNRVTVLVGSAVGPLLRVDNNGGGPALALESNPGAPPLVVNAGAGKVAYLDADRLDGKDASSFLPADGKARDAVRADAAGDAGTLDGRDSTDFYAAGSKVRDSAHADLSDDAGTLDGKDSADFLPASGKATDAEKIDGLDGYQLMRSATYRFHKTSALSSEEMQTITASCPRSPRQLVAISGGASVVVPTAAGEDVVADVPVALKADRPDGYFSWAAEASEISPYEGEWAVKAHVVCVPQSQAIIGPADGGDGTMQPEIDGRTSE